MRAIGPVLMVMAMLSVTVKARAQPTACDLVCCTCADERALNNDAEEAQQTLATAVALFVPAWAASTAYAWTLPGANRFLAGLPIAGAVEAGVRVGERANAAALFFAAGVQTMGVLLAVIGATEMHDVHLRRAALDLSLDANGLHW
jgi:hypothetical protein